MDDISESQLAAMRIGFCLAIRVAKDVIPELSDRIDEITDRLDRLAAGEWTPIPTGAEIRLLYPDTQDVEESRQRDQRAMQAAAGVILDWYSRP